MGRAAVCQRQVAGEPVASGSRRSLPDRRDSRLPPFRPFGGMRRPAPASSPPRGSETPSPPGASRARALSSPTGLGCKSMKGPPPGVATRAQARIHLVLADVLSYLRLLLPFLLPPRHPLLLLLGKEIRSSQIRQQNWPVPILLTTLSILPLCLPRSGSLSSKKQKQRAGEEEADRERGDNQLPST